MRKSIKFKNSTYLDSTSIVHNKTSLSSILNTYNNRKILEYKSSTSKDFNSFYTPGIYGVAGIYTNAPTSNTIYGVLVVLTNDGRTWQKTDNSSWLWQIFITTGGSVYLRNGINSTTPESWKKLH